MHNFKPKSFHFQWHITERCNLRCKHCYFNEKLIKEELPNGSLFPIFDKYIKQLKRWKLDREKARITFMGGEPLIKDNFFEIIQKAYINYKITGYGISSNGTLIDKSVASKLKDLKVDYVQISLEGRKKINDFIRGKGVFEKATDALKFLKKAGLDTSISATISRLNFKELPYIIKIAKDLKVDHLGIRRLVPIGRGKDIKKYFLSPEETKKLYVYLSALSKGKGPRISFGCEDGIVAQSPDYLPKGCSAAYNSFTVLPNGDVYPCRRLPLLSGNLLKESFEKIYYNSKIFQELRNINNINNECSSCPYFAECRGGAKCISFGYFGNPFQPDPQCWRLFSDLPALNMKFNPQKKNKSRMDEKWVDFKSNA